MSVSDEDRAIIQFGDRLGWCSTCLDTAPTRNHPRCTGMRKEWNKKAMKHVLVPCRCPCPGSEKKQQKETA